VYGEERVVSFTIQYTLNLTSMPKPVIRCVGQSGYEIPSRFFCGIRHSLGANKRTVNLLDMSAQTYYNAMPSILFIVSFITQPLASLIACMHNIQVCASGIAYLVSITQVSSIIAPHGYSRYLRRRCCTGLTARGSQEAPDFLNRLAGFYLLNLATPASLLVLLRSNVQWLGVN
jgi:hypothetical protein